MAVTGLAWAPNGNSLVYTSYGGPNREGLWRVRTRAGQVPERVELAGRFVRTPSVSSVRRRLVFSTNRDTGQIWALERDGRTRPMMASLSEWSPSFSPDGRRLAFNSGRSGENIEIWVADADGGNPVQVTQGPGWWQSQPRWSPDGRRLAFNSHGDSGYADIWIVEVASGSLRQATHGALSESSPCWSHDGRFLYYRAGRPDGQDIWRVPDAGGTPERVTEKGGFNPFLPGDGRTLLYTRARGVSPLVERNLEDASERQLVECVAGRNFDVVKEGLYYIGCPDGARGLPFYRLDRRTGRREFLARAQARRIGDGIAVAPSGWPILYETFVSNGDLMLIENFR
jgi:Tol biopolymer transport system component